MPLNDAQADDFSCESAILKLWGELVENELIFGALLDRQDAASFAARDAQRGSRATVVSVHSAL